MQILYIDIDKLRYDHLSCNGYHRQTSPNIDKLSRGSINYDNMYCSNVPTVPSIFANFSNRLGTNNTIIDSDVENIKLPKAIDEKKRGFLDFFQENGYTNTIINVSKNIKSEHAWTHGFSEILSLDSNFSSDNYFLKTLQNKLKSSGENSFFYLKFDELQNFYKNDPRNVFSGSVSQSWCDEKLLDYFNKESCGPISAQDFRFTLLNEDSKELNISEFNILIDKYDEAILELDLQIGRLVNILEELNIYEKTTIVLSSTCGVSLGELNSFCVSGNADKANTHVPAMLKIANKDQKNKRIEALRYKFDIGHGLAKICNFDINKVDSIVDSIDISKDWEESKSEITERNFLLLSTADWQLQRTIRWDRYIAIRTYHDGFNLTPNWQLYDLFLDPHQKNDLSKVEHKLIDTAETQLSKMLENIREKNTDYNNPIEKVLLKGGPIRVRGRLPKYIQSLEKTERSQFAQILAKNHPLASADNK